jgi:hypothetical protein
MVRARPGLLLTSQFPVIASLRSAICRMRPRKKESMPQAWPFPRASSTFKASRSSICSSTIVPRAR